MVLRPKWIEPSQVLTSPAAGTWHPLVKPDQHVERNTLLGRLTDYFGETIAEIRSPMDGVVLYIVASPAMSEGEPIGMVGQVKEHVE